jgi:hypothetical protein
MLSFSACRAIKIFTVYTWLCHAERREVGENLTRELRTSSRKSGLWGNLLEAGEEEQWSQKSRTFGARREGLLEQHWSQKKEAVTARRGLLVTDCPIQVTPIDMRYNYNVWRTGQR